jgi:flagellar protein FliO/FliZ
MDAASLAPQIITLLAALSVVLGLMGIMAYALKKMGAAGAIGRAKRGQSLSIEDSIMIDARRRAILLRRDDRMHLVILGMTGETVVETFHIDPIEAPKTDALPPA